MSVRRYDDVGNFAERVKPFLLQNEAANSLILGLFSILASTDYYREPYLACYERAGEVAGVALRTPPHKVIISPESDEAMAAALADNLGTSYGSLPGFSAAGPLREQFAACWQSRTAQHARLVRKERIYRTLRVIPPRRVSGQYCQPSAENRELLVQWWMDFTAEALDRVSREDAETNVRFRLEGNVDERGMRVWMDQGRVVSMLGYSAPTPSGIRIGPVYTPPEYRGRGYGSALTAAASQELLDQGRLFVSLFADLDNPTSNKIYQAIGYEPVCDVSVYEFV